MLIHVKKDQRYVLVDAVSMVRDGDDRWNIVDDRSNLYITDEPTADTIYGDPTVTANASEWFIKEK